MNKRILIYNVLATLTWAAYIMFIKFYKLPINIEFMLFSLVLSVVIGTAMAILIHGEI